MNFPTYRLERERKAAGQLGKCCVSRQDGERPRERALVVADIVMQQGRSVADSRCSSVVHPTFIVSYNNKNETPHLAAKARRGERLPPSTTRTSIAVAIAGGPFIFLFTALATTQNVETQLLLCSRCFAKLHYPSTLLATECVCVCLSNKTKQKVDGDREVV